MTNSQNKNPPTSKFLLFAKKIWQKHKETIIIITIMTTIIILSIIQPPKKTQKIKYQIKEPEIKIQ